MSHDQMLDVSRHVLTFAAPVLVLAAAACRRRKPAPVPIEGPTSDRIRFAMERARES
jgi:hypothetical protein